MKKQDGDDFLSMNSPRREFIKNFRAGGIAALAGVAALSQASCSSPMTTERSDRMPTRTQMKNMLRQRISWDDPENFNTNAANWDRARLGLYYDEDDELVDIIVYETTANVANMEGRYLPDDVWRNLIANIGPNNTPDEAVDPMMNAAMRAVPLPPGNEGPVINRPRTRPTLRNARRPAGD